MVQSLENEIWIDWIHYGLKKAAIALDVDMSNIAAVCNGRKIATKGLVFRYIK